MAFDYSEFENFFYSLEDMSEQFYSFFVALMKTIGLEAMRRTIPRTPVKTGHLRNSWALSNVEVVGDDFVIYLTNNASTSKVDSDGSIISTHVYASDVEFGHRLVRDGITIGYVEGYFMSTISIKEVSKKIPMIFEKEFKKFVKRHKVG